MIPTFDQLLRPLLAMAAEKKITRRTATEEIAATFKLSPTEAAQRTPSGSSTLIGNRCGCERVPKTGPGGVLVRSVG